MDYEIDFLPVGEGSGDAIVVRYGEAGHGGYLHVIDGGHTETAQTITDHLHEYYPGYPIDHMVLSHADNDHACGLIGVMENFKVSHLWMNRPWLYAEQILEHFHGNFSLQGLIDDIKQRHSYLVKLEELALQQGTVIHEVFQGDRIGAFTVLAPTRERYIESIPDFGKTPDRYSAEAEDVQSYDLLRSLLESAKKKVLEFWDIETLADDTKTSASNESCVVQYSTLGNGVLLTADVGPVGLTEAYEYADQCGLKKPGFVQIPHHGSRRNVTPTVLDAWLGPIKPQGTVGCTAFCSVGSNKHDYPRAQVKNAFIRRGYEVYVTRTRWISHFKGLGHPNTGPITPEKFESEVETI
ncbi:hypothetical protein CNQ84_13815 [Pseudomonas abyssi]|uniref:Metallo-beta-lactamase domain-containing protein n=1 Tax=Pseudomonas abyssi TaxID=170540 RepID=A0A2A3MFQ7_9PSED|nr:MBL fold metallo-hydrolase [Pseudomonas abyssi]PBK03649.1 hypothetical protein CNQ84_13815 [Pseudomonas abyssi]